MSAIETEQTETRLVRLIACPTLSYDHGKIDRYVPAGMTVAEHLRAIGWQPDGLHARVMIDDDVIDQAYWEYAVPGEGQSFITRAMPMGGQNGGKDAMRLVAMLGIVALSIFTASGGLATLTGLTALQAGFTASMVAAGISIVGTLAMTALIPPARPRLQDLSSQNLSPTLSLTGSANQFAPYAPIPRVYGTHRVYPPLAARTFTEIVGRDQYLRMLFCFGYGPLELTDLRIGETPLDQYEGVELELRYGHPDDEPLTLFPQNVFEEPLSIQLTSTFGQRTSQPDATELSVDVTWPSGVGELTRHHGLQAFLQTITVEYRLVGDIDWIPVQEDARAAFRATNFAGANNDLVFTARVIGASGNDIVVRYTPTSFFQVTTNYQQGPAGSRARGTGRVIYVQYIAGVTTSAAIKAATEANSFANSWVIVTHKDADTGAGTIPSPGVFLQLTGGRNLIPAFSAQGPTQSQLRLSRRWTVDAVGQYEVQIRKVNTQTPQSDHISLFDTVFWTAFRTIRTSSPIRHAGLAFAAMRIKATGQLNGTVDQFNALVTSVLPDWNGTEWVPAATNNPASIYRDVLQGSANRRPKQDAQLDLPALQAFHDKCRAEGFAFNAVIDFRTTVKQLRQDVLSAGRGTFHLRDMLYSVLYETLQPVGVAVITPRNSSTPTWTKRFLEIPHAMRVRYVDEQSDYRQGERIVYADGYDATNATVFEESEAGLGVTHSTQVWKLKMRELAEAKLRADEYSVQMDFEHLQFTRGDRVEFQHDAVLFGLASARVLDAVIDGDDLITQLTLDAPVIMESGTEYGVRIWKGSGGSCVGKCVTVPGTVAVLDFATPIAESVGVAIGDLLTFGLFGQESVACVVKSIRPGPDYSATVSLVDYAPAIMTADSVPIPPYEGNVTHPAIDRFVLSQPIIDRIQSDEAVLVRAHDGALSSRILITVTFSSGFRVPVDRLEAHFRRSDSEAPWIQLGAAVDGTTAEIALTPVEDEVSYDFRLRSVDTRTGATSEWTAIQGHVVVGKTTSPPDVEMVVLEGDRMRWNYPDPPPDLAGYVVRYRYGVSRSWTDASPAHDGVLLTTDFTIFRGTGPMTFLVKAIDVAGNVSESPGAVTVNFGAALIENIVIEDNHRALGWPGTKTNGAVVADQLQAATSTPFWTNNSALFWGATESALFWTASYLEMRYEFSVVPPAEFLDAILRLPLTVLGEWTVQYRSDSSASMWSVDDSVAMWGSASNPMWSPKGPYTQWPGQLAPLALQAYEFLVVTQAGLQQGILDQLRVQFDVHDLFESLNDLVIAPGGTRLPLTKTFRQIHAVRLDLQDDGGNAAYLKVIDKDLVLHPLVEAFTSSDVTTGALIDAVVQGI